VTGSWPPFAEIRTLPAEEGRFYNWEDLAQARRVAFIGSDAKKQLFGVRQAVGQTIRIGDFPYVVIGVMQNKEQDSSYDGRDISKVFVPLSAMQDPPKSGYARHCRSVDSNSEVGGAA
jgi:putative ABC transport system permease protein